jgi:hypothetical protein
MYMRSYGDWEGGAGTETVGWPAPGGGNGVVASVNWQSDLIRKIGCNSMLASSTMI